MLGGGGAHSTREGFAEAITEVAALRPKLVVLGADVTGSLFLTTFAERYPNQFISVGIAEQNMAGLAAGLAMCGYTPVMATYAAFCTTRALDQIRVSICYNALPVLIAGAHAGLSVGPDGATHQALEDIAVMRTLPRMRVFSPCDANQAYALTRAMLLEGLSGPTYIRLGRMNVPNHTSRSEVYEGGFMPVSQGKDLTMVATGHMLWVAIETIRRLAKEHVGVALLNMYEITAPDWGMLLESVRDTRLVVTLEEHQRHGGMGSAVAEVLGERCPAIIRSIGVNDEFGQSGAPDLVMLEAGLGVDRVCRMAMELFRLKGEN